MLLLLINVLFLVRQGMKVNSEQLYFKAETWWKFTISFAHVIQVYEILWWNSAWIRAVYKWLSKKPKSKQLQSQPLAQAKYHFQPTTKGWNSWSRPCKEKSKPILQLHCNYWPIIENVLSSFDIKWITSQSKIFMYPQVMLVTPVDLRIFNREFTWQWENFESFIYF